MTHTQLELPEDVIRQFHMPAEWVNRKHIVLRGQTLTILPVYRLDASKAPKYVSRYKPVHYRDWIKSQTRPWKRPVDKDITWFLSKYGKSSDEFEYQEME